MQIGNSKYELNKVYCEDCVEAMKQMPDNFFDLAIVDPEWGRGEHGGKERSSLCKQKNGSVTRIYGGAYSKKTWDNKPAGEEYFKELIRVSKHQIIWGVNYYGQVFGSGRIIWDKVNGNSDQSDCEIAYNSMTSRVDQVAYMWNGMNQGVSVEQGRVMQGNKKLNEKRIHPTQKPAKLYQWLYGRFAERTFKIIDTHGGSMSSIVAAIDFGCDWVAFEIDKEYYDNAVDRINGHIRKPKLDFEQASKVYHQLTID